jgi:hypothetical protein
MRYREGAKGVPAIKRRVPRSFAKLDWYFFAQLRALRAFAVKLFGLRAKPALGLSDFYLWQKCIFSAVSAFSAVQLNFSL